MGRDKSLLLFRGKRLIDFSLAVLSHFSETILISTQNPALARLGFPLVADEFPGIGPISGLYSALKASQTRNNLIIPCDTPNIDASVYERLMDNAGDCLAAVAGSASGLREPLIGYYDRSAVEVLGGQIRAGDYKLQNALGRLEARIEVFSDARLFLNLNAPSDLRGGVYSARERDCEGVLGNIDRERKFAAPC